MGADAPAQGGSSSHAGIPDFPLNFRPRYPVIHGLDDMKAEDVTVLLSPM